MPTFILRRSSLSFIKGGPFSPFIVLNIAKFRHYLPILGNCIFNLINSLPTKQTLCPFLSCTTLKNTIFSTKSTIWRIKIMCILLRMHIFFLISTIPLYIFRGSFGTDFFKARTEIYILRRRIYKLQS